MYFRRYESQSKEGAKPATFDLQDVEEQWLVIADVLESRERPVVQYSSPSSRSILNESETFWDEYGLVTNRGGIGVRQCPAGFEILAGLNCDWGECGFGERSRWRFLAYMAGLRTLIVA